MGRVKLQFFLVYAMFGCLLPFLAVFLKRERNLSEIEIGYILATSSMAVLVTPVLITLLADSRFDPRRLTGAIFLTSGAVLFSLGLTEGFWPALILLLLHSLAFASMVPLSDGLYFSLEKQQRQEGAAGTSYHFIRVWGTVGFIVPSLFLFGFFQAGFSTGIILIAAIVVSLIGWINTLVLPPVKSAEPKVESVGESLSPRKKIPTFDAASALFGTRERWIFCVGMVFAHVAGMSYFGFFPLYLTEAIGVEEKWIGLIFNFGVALEIVFILAFGKIYRWLGMKRLMVLGMLCMTGRTGFLALFPTIEVALLTQLLHGMGVLALLVAPVYYLNEMAGDHYRSSIQGLYTMTIVGASRIGGSILSGYLASTSLPFLFMVLTVLGFCATLIFWLGFRGTTPAPKGAYPYGDPEEEVSTAKLAKSAKIVAGRERN